ncbi:hypothetical protein CLOP_g22177 [Closterium sp. NIES-67]|nr:hypothetical protein CLOP_g22177 [Closterium sp. NIES-67]
MASYYVPQGPTANGISDIERELEELRDSYRQVCEERDALEDLLLQEQLKNGAPADKQLEEARAHAAALEMELQSMASRCEEWKRRAGERAAEMHPAMVQALLEERLEELDESGVLALQVECARLRDELAKSEVLRFELYRSLAQGAVEVESRWESEASGMSPRRESSLGRRDEESNDGDAEDASERRTTPPPEFVTAEIGFVSPPSCHAPAPILPPCSHVPYCETATDGPLSSTNLKGVNAGNLGPSKPHPSTRSFHLSCMQISTVL